MRDWEVIIPVFCEELSISVKKKSRELKSLKRTKEVEHC